MKVNEVNYLRLLQETLSVLNTVSGFLSNNRTENRVELACLSQAMKQIQGVLRTQRIKAIKAKTQG